MNIDVEKYLLLGPMSKRDIFFEKIQRLGIIEFITPKPLASEKSNRVETIIEALRILRRMVPKKESPSSIGFDSAQVLAQHIVEINEHLEKNQEKARILEKEISRIEPFGDFSKEELQEVEERSHRKIQFFFAKHETAMNAMQKLDGKDLEENNLIHVASAHGLEYFISINKEKRSYPGFIEILIDHPLGDLQNELAQIRAKIEDDETTLGSLSHHKKLLKQGLAKEINRFHLQEAKGGIEMTLDGEMFAICGWVPKNKVSLLQEVADAHAIHIEAIRTEQDDRTPTYLENHGLAKVGEDLIQIYDTPSIKDRDPSLWVFFAFTAFFSVIVSDAGYGVILLFISIYLYYKFRKKGALAHRLIKLCMALSIGCIAWGILAFSFFGIEISPHSKWQKVSLTNWMAKEKAAYIFEHKGPTYDEWVKKFPEVANSTNSEEFLLGAVKNDGGYESHPMYNEFVNNFLLEFALFIGTIHIILSFLRYLDKSWSGLGWVIFMIGCYLYFPSILNATSLIHYVFHVPYEAGAAVGKIMLFSGLGIAAVLAVIQKKWGGVAEVMHSIQVFADVMSYLRLYALSLAGMVMATTFDKMGASAPIYIGPFIILAGHAVNFTLALMGGLIHGLRLNFIEWYHYSFEGGGKKFNPLSLIKLD